MLTSINLFVDWIVTLNEFCPVVAACGFVFAVEAMGDAP